MAPATLDKKGISRILQAIPKIIKLPASSMRVDYDAEADVVYLSFAHPQRATDSEMRDDGIIIHRRGERVVGMTVLEASTR